MAFDLACDAAGIDQEKAKDLIKKRLENVDGSAAGLRAVASGALITAIDKFKKLIEEGPRRSAFEQKLYNTDLEAAKSLARLATDALKISGGTKNPSAPGPQQLDLWDAAQRSNWSLKKPE